jgi:hypothetical protein
LVPYSQQNGKVQARWGDQSWTFSIVAAVMSFKAYCGPEKYWLVFVGLLAAYLFNIDFIFLATVYQQWQNERQVL